MKLPDEFIELVRQYSGAEDSAKMNTAQLMSEFWLEYGKKIEHEGKDRKWFVESTAAHVSMSPSSMYNRLRVGDNWIARGYYTQYDDISFGAALALLRNSESVDGLVPVEVLDKRVDWYYEQMDKFGGQPPSVRDIDKHYKKNGAHPEWEQYWNIIVRNAKKLKEIEHPNVYDGALDTIIAVDKSKKFDVPTVIYKGEGWTGAQKDER